MQIITGIGESEHVTSMQHRAIFEMVIGNDSYILNKGELLKPELQSNNALKIRSGMLAHHGCISEVAPNTYDEVAIGNGSQNMKRIDLVVARYTQNAETKVERTEWTVIQGQPVESNPVAPDYIHGNMQDGDLTDDCPVFEVHLDGIQVVEIKKLLNVLDGSLAELNRNMESREYEFESIVWTNPTYSIIRIGRMVYIDYYCPVSDGFGGYAYNIAKLPNSICPSHHSIKAAAWTAGNNGARSGASIEITPSGKISFVAGTNFVETGFSVCYPINL